jgi:predicted Ser/Thr protein kinase
MESRGVHRNAIAGFLNSTRGVQFQGQLVTDRLAGLSLPSRLGQDVQSQNSVPAQVDAISPEQQIPSMFDLSNQVSAEPPAQEVVTTSYQPEPTPTITHENVGPSRSRISDYDRLIREYGLGDISAVGAKEILKNEGFNPEHIDSFFESPYIQSIIDPSFDHFLSGARQRNSEALYLNMQGKEASDRKEWREALQKFEEAYNSNAFTLEYLENNDEQHPVLDQLKERVNLIQDVLSKNREDAKKMYWQHSINRVSANQSVIEEKRDAGEFSTALKYLGQDLESMENIVKEMEGDLDPSDPLFLHARELTESLFQSGLTRVSGYSDDGLASMQPTIDSATDKTISGWQRGEMIAEGGMGQVFYSSSVDGQQGVWKQAYGKHLPMHKARYRLREEAAFLSENPHSRIPILLATGEWEDSDPSVGETDVLIMEYIEGGNLQADVEVLSKAQLSFSTSKIIETISKVIEPLELLIGLPAPIYHRDLKPQNIILHPKRGPIIIDWDLAKIVESGEDLSVTRGGSGVWTAPERGSGISGSFTDVHSLGKIMYYLATNEKPNAIMTQSEMVKIVQKGHPEWLGTLINWASYPQHQQRIQTVKHLRILLNNEGQWPEEEVTEAESASSDDYTTWD